MAAPAVAKDQKNNRPLSRLERKLLDADKLELFSLSPNYYMFHRVKWPVPGQTPPEQPPEQPLAEQGFYGHKILGILTITHPKVRRQLARQLIENFHRPGATSECFDPHHGLRIYDKGTTVDLVLCYSCGRMNTYGLEYSEDEISLGNGFPPLLYTLFRDDDIPYEGPKLEIADDVNTSTARQRVPAQ